MRTHVLLLTFLMSSISYAQTTLICVDGNEPKSAVVKVQFDLNRSRSYNRENTTPCYVNPYDGYQCDADNPHVYIEKVMEISAQITVANGSSVSTKEVIVVGSWNTEFYTPDEDYNLSISEEILEGAVKMNLSITGTLNYSQNKFTRGFELGKTGSYVSVNTLHLEGIDRPYYLLCTGLH